MARVSRLPILSARRMGVERTKGGGCDSPRAWLGNGRWTGWEPDLHARSALWGIGEAGLAAPARGQLGDDCQAESGPRRAAAPVGASVEALEHPLAILGGDAPAVVGHGHHRPTRAVGCPHPDRGSWAP